MEDRALTSEEDGANTDESEEEGNSREDNRVDGSQGAPGAEAEEASEDARIEQQMRTRSGRIKKPNSMYKNYVV